MNKITIVLGIVILCTFAGCAFLQKVAPSQLDEAGQPIPGTHTLNETAQAVATNLGPYGSAAAAIPLLIWNFVELVRAKKDQKGLIATVKALKQAGDDPKTKEAFEAIKGYLKNAHSVAGVDSVIKNLLAKL